MKPVYLHDIFILKIKKCNKHEVNQRNIAQTPVMMVMAKILVIGEGENYRKKN